jgi:hypothetical protein
MTTVTRWRFWNRTSIVLHSLIDTSLTCPERVCWKDAIMGKACQNPPNLRPCWATGTNCNLTPRKEYAAQQPPWWSLKKIVAGTEYYDTNNDLLRRGSEEWIYNAAYPPVSSSHLTRSPKLFGLTQDPVSKWAGLVIIKIVDLNNKDEDVLDPRGFNLLWSTNRSTRDLFQLSKVGNPGNLAVFSSMHLSTLESFGNRPYSTWNEISNWKRWPRSNIFNQDKIAGAAHQAKTMVKWSRWKAPTTAWWNNKLCRMCCGGNYKLSCLMGAWHL